MRRNEDVRLSVVRRSDSALICAMCTWTRRLHSPISGLNRTGIKTGCQHCSMQSINRQQLKQEKNKREGIKDINPRPTVVLYLSLSLSLSLSLKRKPIPPTPLPKNTNIKKPPSESPSRERIRINSKPTSSSKPASHPPSPSTQPPPTHSAHQTTAATCPGNAPGTYKSSGSPGSSRRDHKPLP